MSTSPLTASVERTIASSASTIFDLIATPSRHHEFDGSGTVKGTFNGPSGIAKLGDTFGMDMHLGFDYKMVNTIIEFEPGRRIAWQTRPDNKILGMLVGGRIWRYELDPQGTTSTKVRETWDLRQERGVKALIFAAGRSKTVKNMAATLDRIAEVVTD